MEETHYYPFGLTMAGISSKALKNQYAENKYKFNSGTELNSDFDINLYETTFRSLDPQIGRFWEVDPLADLSESWSPYVYANDNPIFYNDPFGLTADSTGKPPACSGGDCPTGKMAEVKELEEVVVTAVRPKKPQGSTSTVIDLGDGELPVSDDVTSEQYIAMLGFDPHDPVSVLQQTVVGRPDAWDRFCHGSFYRGTNAFGERLYRPHYGGTAPSSGSFGRMAGFTKLFQIRSARSWEDLMQWGKNLDVLNKLKTVSATDILRLKNAGVTVEELKLWSTSYAAAIGKKAGQSNYVAKLRKDLVDKLIELW